MPGAAGDVVTARQWETLFFMFSRYVNRKHKSF